MTTVATGRAGTERRLAVAGAGRTGSQDAWSRATGAGAGRMTRTGARAGTGSGTGHAWSAVTWGSVTWGSVTWTAVAGHTGT